MVYVWLFCVIHGCLEVSKYNLKNTLSYFCYRIRDNEGRQAAAASKCEPLNTGYRIRDSDGGQTAALLESLPTNGCN